MRITSKGQVTIPVAIRERAGLLPNTEVEFVAEGNAIRIVRSPPRHGRSPGDRLVSRLRGSATIKMTTDQIMNLTRKP